MHGHGGGTDALKRLPVLRTPTVRTVDSIRTVDSMCIVLGARLGVLDRCHRMLYFYHASLAFLWTVPVLMARRHRLVDFYRASLAFLWTVPVLMDRCHSMVYFYHCSIGSVHSDERFIY